MSETIQIELSEEEAAELRRSARDRHNSLARQQQSAFGDSADMEELSSVSTEQAAKTVLLERLRD